MNIAGCVAMITGADAGLGPAFAEALLARGARRVYVASVETVSLRALLRGADRRLTPMPLDVTDPDQVAAAASIASDVTLLINNASESAMPSRVGKHDIAAARMEIEVNYLGLLDMMTAFAPTLARHAGAIVNVLPTPADIAHPDALTHAASLAAARSLTRGFRDGLAAQGVRVIGILARPGTGLAGTPAWPAPPFRIASDTLDALASGVNADLPP